MRHGKRIWNTAVYEMIQLLCSAKFWLITVTAYIFMDYSLDGIRDLAVDYRLTMPPVLLTFYYADGTFCNIGLLMLVFLLSDAPFRDSNQKYLLLRSGRTDWCAGQVAAMAGVALLYVAEEILLSIWHLRGMISWDGWGKVWGSVADKTAFELGYVGHLGAEQSVISWYTPAQALLLSALLIWLVCCIYGALVFMLNSIGKGRLGTITLAVWSAIWLVLDEIAESKAIRWLMQFAPQSFCDLSKIKPDDFPAKAAFLAGAAIILNLVAVFIVRRKKEL